MPSKYSSPEGKQMADNTTRRTSSSVLIPVLAALLPSQVLLMNSDYGNGVRYGLGGLAVLVMLVVVFRLSRNRTAD
jgi:hypothetical protein